MHEAQHGQASHDNARDDTASRVESCLDAGNYRNPHEPVVRQAIAGHLAQLVALTRPLAGTPDAQALVRDPLPPGVLWPKPHSVIFDFEATAAGAEWIDDIARRADQMLETPAGDVVIGHTDWSAKRFRFVGDGVTAIYDWDSLVSDHEPVLAGQAAHAFTATWNTPWENRVPMAPTFDELLAFFREYEGTRGAPFSADERRTADAAAAYSIAYTSRCGHARNPLPGPDAALPPGSFREALRAYGERLLEL